MHILTNYLGHMSASTSSSIHVHVQHIVKLHHISEGIYRKKKKSHHHHENSLFLLFSLLPILQQQ